MSQIIQRGTKQPYELDYSDHLRQAYYDCVVSLNALETMTRNIPGAGINEMFNKVSHDRFNGTVDILYAMILDSVKDDDFTAAYGKLKEKDDFQFHLHLFHILTELLNRQNVFKGKSVDFGRI